MTKAFQSTVEVSRKQAESQLVPGDTPAAEPVAGRIRPVVGLSAFLLGLLGICPASEAADVDEELSNVTLHEVHLEAFKTFRSPDGTHPEVLSQCV